MADEDAAAALDTTFAVGTDAEPNAADATFVADDAPVSEEEQEQAEAEVDGAGEDTDPAAGDKTSRPASADAPTEEHDGGEGDAGDTEGKAAAAEETVVDEAAGGGEAALEDGAATPVPPASEPDSPRSSQADSDHGAAEEDSAQTSPPAPHAQLQSDDRVGSARPSSGRPLSGRPVSGRSGAAAHLTTGNRPSSGTARRVTLADPGGTGANVSRASSASRRRSSRPGSGVNADDPFAGLSLEELERELQRQESENSLLIRETHCLERFWDRQGQALREEVDEPTHHMPSKDAGQRGHRRRSRPSKSNTTNSIRAAPLELTDAQKGDIAQRDLEFLQSSFDKFCSESDRAVHTLAALVSEAELRLAELPTLQNTLQTEVADAAAKTRNKMPELEALQRFYDHRIRACTSMIDKLEVKNRAMRTKQTRMQAQMRSKEEIGGSLHKVDFEQLKIENTRFAEIMDERVRELLNLKVVVGSTNNNLNSLKKRLKQLEVEEQELQKEITKRKDLFKKVDAEVTRVEEQAASMQTVNAKLRKELAEYRPPDVMDLVKEQAAIPDLRSKMKTMERKVELAQMEFSRTQRTVRGTQRGGHG